MIEGEILKEEASQFVCPCLLNNVSSSLRPFAPFPPRLLLLYAEPAP